jgi:hypothetical protein
MGLTAATGAAEADGGGAAGVIAEASGSTGEELPRLESNIGVDQVAHLIVGATRALTFGGVLERIEIGGKLIVHS